MIGWIDKLDVGTDKYGYGYGSGYFVKSSYEISDVKGRIKGEWRERVKGD